jgi:Flp pilus assembly pilin Flp
MRLSTETVRRFIADERGLETVEYAIIAGLIVAGAIATIATIGGYVASRFQALENALKPAAPPAPPG